MADNRTMAQMLQAPIEGYEDAIVVPPINANNFELKQPLINLVQSNKFTDGEARDWLDKEPPRSILTWDDLIPQEGLAINESKSKVRYSRSRPNDLRAITNAPSSTSSPSDNSFEIQQLAALLEDKMNIRMSRLEKAISEKNATTPATVKAVEEVCVTCGSNHNFNNCPLTRNDFPVFQDNIQQFQQTAAVGNFVQRNPPNLANQMRPPDFENYVKANDAVLKNVQNQGQNLQNQMANVTSLLTSLCDNFKNSVSTSNSGTLPSQTVTNPRQQINAITTRSETNSYPSKLPYPERMKVRENDKPSAQYSRFLKMFKQLRLEIGLKDALVEMPKFNKWLSSLLRNKEKLEEIAITTVNDECSAIIMNKVPKKLKDPVKFLIPCALQELNRTSALAVSGASINFLPHSIYKKLGLEALTPTRMTLELANRSITHTMGIVEDVVVRVDGFTFLADFVVVNFEPDPRVPIILGRPFLRTAKALIDLYEETLTLRVGKEELVYYADKSEKNKEKNFVHTISIIDFLKDDPFSGSTTNTLSPSSSPVKTSDNLEKFADELAPLDSLPPGNDDSTLKKDFHEETFQVYSNPLFKFDDNFKSSNVNPLFEENDKDVKESPLIPPGIDLTLPSALEVSSSNPTSPTLTREKVCSWKTPMFFSLVRFVWKMMTRIAIRKKIICLLATYLHQKSKPLSQEVEEITEKEDAVSSDVPIHTIVMPIRITFENLIDFNDHFSKPKDFKKDLTISFYSSESSILPSPLLDSDSPFTARLSASVTLNSLGNEDKVFKPGILVYHAIHDKNLVTLEENLKENISSGTLLVFKEPSFLLPPPKPPNECLKNVVLNDDFYQSKKRLYLNVEDVNSFTFIIWIFLPYFTYTKESPLIFSFRSENFVFDTGIVTFHKPVAFLMKVFYSLSLRTNKFRDRVELATRINPTIPEDSRVRCTDISKFTRKTAQKREARTRERKSVQKPEAKPKKKSILSQIQSKWSNHGQQNSLSSSSHVAMEKAHKDVGFTLHLLSKEAQVSLKRIATLAIRVRSLSDPTAQNVDPMIG
ncbi:reverse transcriptase domain-containing protein [Tanacetum coccineum]|uniref:Reverse transcriptase domain-containing protein n=1 Tax=Tanacetum coccineum TaxID=301880 RepID=A0ABQ5E346_9ASTR